MLQYYIDILSPASRQGRDRRGFHRMAANPHMLSSFVVSSHMLPHLYYFVTCCHMLPWKLTMGNCSWRPCLSWPRLEAVNVVLQHATSSRTTSPQSHNLQTWAQTLELWAFEGPLNLGATYTVLRRKTPLFVNVFLNGSWCSWTVRELFVIDSW